MEWSHDIFQLSDNRDHIDITQTHQLLSDTYWGVRRPLEVVEEMIETSLCFTLRVDEKQVGFGRAVTDKVTFSWIADIVISPVHRGKGVGKWMMECILSHPDIINTQKVLQTRDAHEYYEKYDFTGNSALMSTPVDGL